MRNLNRMFQNYFKNGETPLLFKTQKRDAEWNELHLQWEF